MTIENNKKRKDTAHGLRAPMKPGSKEFVNGLNSMFKLVELAKTSNKNNWRSVQQIIEGHIPFDISQDISDVMLKFGFETWRDCVNFVKDDECVEFMVKIAHYAKKRKIPVQKDRDFIDGEGVGLYARWAEKTDEILEKVFDQKYHFDQIRPLEYCRKGGFGGFTMVNYMHPGHPAYPAGHGGKFYSSVSLARETWKLSEEQDRDILIASVVLAMARSGGGVHYPEDNIASGYTAGLKEFDSYGEKKKESKKKDTSKVSESKLSKES